MILKKHKAVISALLAAALTAAAVMPATVSAAGTRNKDEKFGDSTYGERFLSLYDDVVTNGVENGYLSGGNIAPGGFGVPYHSVEELIVEAPDYGHETTSEAMSYIVWMAAMHDNIANKTGKDSVGDLEKAWNTLEVIIPKEQSGMMLQQEPKATLSKEWDNPEEYYGDNIRMYDGNIGVNPIHKYFTKAYSGDEGLYLMHWLADVDDWYGYGGGGGGTNKGKFTFINTFQRGSEESCFETVPHPSIETLEYGSAKGVKGIFKTAEEDVPAQWAYTNAPDAEDRAIQAVYAANRWKVGNSSVSAKAAKMGDECRNNMFDKYYKAMGTTNFADSQKLPSGDEYGEENGCHYLMSWYTSWGGAMNGSWTWQIGASHCHEFYQNPLAAFALVSDPELKSGMKAQNAEEDYKKSLQRQMEFYLWLQSADGPIAGGATNSWLGRYETPEYKDDDVAHFGSSTPTTFYKMSYVEHPVYADPGSNHWIGNQVWAVQRLAEMYYVIKTEGDTTGVKAGGLTLEKALEAILDRWVDWFVKNVNLYEDDTYDIPSNLDWFGQPAKWNGSYDPSANAKLTCEITGRGSSDLGCVSSLCNTLIYYAKAKGVTGDKASAPDESKVEEMALYTARELLDREWELGRDDIGLTMTEHNGSLKRIFEQTVFIPEYYSGKMPNGDPLENGATFISFRSQYRSVPKFDELEAAYNDGGDTSVVDLQYHRFWHAGDILLALGTMEELYGDEITPGGGGTIVSPTNPTETEPTEPTTEDRSDSIVVAPGSITVEVGKSEQITVTVDGEPVDAEFSTTKPNVVEVSPDGTVTGVGVGQATIMVTVPGVGEKVVNVTVKAESTTAATEDEFAVKWGDANDDKIVNVADVVTVNLFILNEEKNKLGDGSGAASEARGTRNADVSHNGEVDIDDSTLIMNYVAEIIKEEQLAPKK